MERDNRMPQTGRRPTKPNLQNTPAPTGERGKKIRRAMTTTTVTVRCIGCGATREIKAYEIPAGEVPVCHMPECFAMMLAVKATAK
jgi:hypothetical protein